MSFLNRVNSETIAQLFLNSLKIIYKDDIQFNKILLVVTDAEPYMKKAFRNISILLPKCYMSTIYLIILMESVKQLEQSPQLQIYLLITSKMYSKKVLYVSEFSNAQYQIFLFLLCQP